MPPAAPPLPLCDAHAHLHDPRIPPALRDHILAAAPAAGLAHVHLCATSPADWDPAIALATAHRPLLSASIGIHPFHAADAPPDAIPLLRARLQSAPIPLGIGEIGLDGPLDDDAPAAAARRRALFLAQLDLSCELALPVTLHGRGRWPELVDLLLSRPPHPAGVLLHAYGGPTGPLRRLAEKNVYVSLSALLLRPRARKAPAIARAASPGHLLLETDAPDCPPPAHAQSSPLHLPLYLSALANALALPPRALAHRLHANFLRLFSPLLAPPPAPSAHQPFAPPQRNSAQNPVWN